MPKANRIPTRRGAILAHWPIFLALASVLGMAACTFLVPDDVVVLSLRPDAPTKNLGELGQGETLACDFILTNELPFPIEIMDVVRSCGGCTEVQVANPNLGPNDSTRLRAIWKTGSSRGAAGFQLWVVYKMPGGRFGDLPLRVEGFVAPDIDYSPAKVEFRQGRAESQLVMFRPGRLGSFELYHAYTNDRAFRAELQPDGRSVLVTFDPSAGTEASSLAVLSVDSSSRHEPTIRIPLVVGNGVVTD